MIFPDSVLFSPLLGWFGAFWVWKRGLFNKFCAVRNYRQPETLASAPRGLLTSPNDFRNVNSGICHLHGDANMVHRLTADKIAQDKFTANKLLGRPTDPSSRVVQQLRSVYTLPLAGDKRRGPKRGSGILFLPYPLTQRMSVSEVPVGTATNVPSHEDCFSTGHKTTCISPSYVSLVQPPVLTYRNRVTNWAC